MSRPDVIVIGAGLAGMTAAVRLAEGGARVLVLAKGVGSTQLSGMTIDVLGYAPARVDSPRAALAAVAPDHPYARVGVDGVAAALEWFKERFGYVGSLGTRTSCCRPRSAWRSRRASCRRRWPPGTCAPMSRSWRSGSVR